MVAVVVVKADTTTFEMTGTAGDDTVKLWDTVGAGLNVRLPAWSARTVHRPAATSVIVAPLVPPAVHTAGVDVLNETGSNDVAVADTVTGDCASVFAASAPNVIVWFVRATAAVVNMKSLELAGPTPLALRAW